MTETFQVNGPAKLMIQSTSGGIVASTNWGYTTNDDLITVEFEDFVEPLYATDTGDAPADHVWRGRIAIISGTMSKWDTAINTTLLAGPVASGSIGAEGTVGDIGAVIGTGGTSVENEFTLIIDSALAVSATRPTYTFSRCVIPDGNSLRMFQFGNTNTKLAFRMLAFPASGVLYTVATS